jgi:hypothetical protein
MTNDTTKTDPFTFTTNIGTAAQFLTTTTAKNTKIYEEEKMCQIKKKKKKSNDKHSPISDF